MTDAVLRTVVRRETHSPRTVAMLVVVVLRSCSSWRTPRSRSSSPSPAPSRCWSRPARRSTPSSRPHRSHAVAFIVGGVVLAILGLIVLVIALKPGRLSRHEMEWGQRAVVVDNGVVASALAST